MMELAVGVLVQLGHVLAVLAAAAIGTFGGGFIQDRVARRRETREAQNLARAFAGEISSMVTISDKRDYRTMVENIIQELRNGNDVPMPRISDPNVTITEHMDVFKVHSANAGRVGLLHAEDAEAIAGFYTRMMGVLSDTIRWARGYSDDENRESKIAILKADLALWEEAMEMGRKLIPRLQRY